MNYTLIDSNISQVCVFAKGVEVTRELKLEGTNWPEKLKITNLPLCLDDSTIKPSIRTSDNEKKLPTICDLRVTLETPADCDAKTTHLPKTLIDAENELELLTRQLHIIEETVSQLNISTIQNRGKLEKQDIIQTPLKARLAFVEFVERELTKYNEKKKIIKQRVKETKNTIKRLKNEQKRKGTPETALKHELKKSVLIKLAGIKQLDPSGVVLEISYRVPGAYWMPAYALKIDEDYKHASIQMRAVICQNTGEHWKNVTLSLSTALPQNWVEIPSLNSLKIGRKQFAKDDAWHPCATDVGALFNDYDQFFGKGKGVKPIPPKSIQEFKHYPVDPSIMDEFQGVYPKFILLSESLRGKRFDLNKREMTIGSDLSNDIAIADSSISSLEAILSLKNGRCTIEKKTKKGMMVNGQNITKKVLLNSDILQIGDVEILFDCDERAVSTVMRTQTGIDLEQPVACVAVPAQIPPSAAPGLFRSEKSKARLGRAPSHDTSVESLMVAEPLLDEAGMLPPPAPMPSQAPPAPPKPVTPKYEKCYKYGNLRMPGPLASNRGVLNISSQIDMYLELVVEQNISFASIEEILSYYDQQTQHVYDIPIPFQYRKIKPGKNYSFIYHPELAVDIPSDSKLHSVPVETVPVDISVLYKATPRKLQKVFKTIAFTNPFSGPILEGPIDIYYGQEFITTSESEHIPQNGKFTVGLGVEEAVKISRNTSFKEDTTGLIKGTLNLHHQIMIEVINHLSGPINLEIYERLPITNEDEEQIDVKIEAVNPEWQEYSPHQSEEKMGFYKWVEEIAPTEKKEFDVKYNISLPSKHELIDGNRREV